MPAGKLRRGGLGLLYAKSFYGADKHEMFAIKKKIKNLLVSL